MENIIIGIVAGVAIFILLVILIVALVKLFKMKPEERKKILITFLKGAVSFAEQEIGAGHGDDKFALVEQYFDKYAGWFLKMVLSLTGKKNLKELIELALAEVKKTWK